jgi:hypothetical protein
MPRAEPWASRSFQLRDEFPEVPDIVEKMSVKDGLGFLGFGDGGGVRGWKWNRRGGDGFAVVCSVGLWW